jgi:L-ascorbate metabolism protein UlaG (beta-lactamase superfamily)
MELIWLGLSCFRIRSREAAVLTDPFPKSGGLSMGRPAADIVTVSSAHPDHSYLAGVSGSPLVIWGPGEYESAGILVTGIATNLDEGRAGREGKNTAYVIELEGLRICHLGRPAQAPSSEQAETMSNVDLLLIPVGGQGSLDGAAAAEAVNLLEPRLIVPMSYAVPGSQSKLDTIDRFLREMGSHPAEPQPRLTVTRSTLPAEPEVAILTQAASAGRVTRKTATH